MATKGKTVKSKAKTTSNEIAVMVTTNRRGVFFGYIDPSSIDGDMLAIKRARCCVKWVGARGFLGLANEGPGAQCRVSPAASELRVPGLQSTVEGKATAVIRVSAEAIARWEAAPWGA